MELVWWAWLVLGIGLMLAELALGSLFIFWFGLGALVVGGTLAAFPGLSFSAQLMLWIIASTSMVWLWFRVFRPEFHKTRSGLALGEAIGEVGLLVREVAPFTRGEVRFQKPLLGADRWDCIADEQIEPGERVRVIGVEGSLLRVIRQPRSHRPTPGSA